MIKKVLPILILITLPLTACTRYEWVKPLGDSATYPNDNYVCVQKGLELAPPVFQTYETSHILHKTKKIVETNCAHTASSEKCSKTVERKTYNSPQRTTDLNSSNRKELYNACMQAKGWVLKQVEEQ